MSRDVRKPDFRICENKDADQIRGNREADQRLCFRYLDSTTPLLSKIRNFKSLAIFCDFPARFVSDLVGNPEDRFSDVAAQMVAYLNPANHARCDQIGYALVVISSHRLTIGTT